MLLHFNFNVINFNVIRDTLLIVRHYRLLAEIATRNYKQYKMELDCGGYIKWRMVAGEGWKEVMMEADRKMEYCLSMAVSHYTLALSKAQAADDQGIGRSVARNLLLCYSHLVTKVWPSIRLSIYSVAASTFSTALQLGAGDKEWLHSSAGGRKGVTVIFDEIVEQWGGKCQINNIVPGGFQSDVFC